jgi:Tol biopolymer transport system component
MFGKRSCAVAAVSASAIATQLACPGYSWAATERAAASPATSENPGAIAPSPEVAVSSPMDGAAFSAVSVTSRGAGPGYEPSVSSDGHYVAFVDYSGHIYVTDTETDTPTPGVLVDAGSGGAQANKYAFAPVISGSGRYVTFASWATNLLADGAGDGVFQRDLQTGTTVRLSVDGSGAPIDADPVAGVPGPVYAGPGGADPVNGPASSSDGGVVAFVLDDPACDNFTYDVVDYTGNEIAVPMADGGDGYVWDRRTGTATRLPGCVRAPAVSGNGSFVAYDTADASGVFHVYGWDTATSASAGELSVDAAGLVISGRTPSVSEDGRYVAFVTGAVAGNEQGDLRGGTVVVRDRVAGTTKLARHPNEDAAFGADIASAPRLSADGRYVTFAEASRLFCSGAISASGSIPTASFGGEIYAGACGPYFSSGVYVADMRTGTFARMDLDESLAPLAPGRGCSDCYFDGEPSISSDGRYVAFAGIGRFGSGDDGAYLRDRTQTPVFVPSAELRGDDYFCPVCQSSKTRLDPINTATGAYQRQDNDVTPAGGGLGFSLERDYSSDDTNVGLFGTGWASNLGTSLTVLPSGDARVTSGTGAVVAFAREADGSYLAPPEVRATLAALMALI